jgi:hypothetical protein
MGWTTRNKFKDASEDAHYHKLLTTVLTKYYSDFAATVKYYCAEHKHPRGGDILEDQCDHHRLEQHRPLT